MHQKGRIFTNAKGKVVELVTLVLVRLFAASIQGEGVLAKGKSQSGLGTMQT